MTTSTALAQHNLDHNIVSFTNQTSPAVQNSTINSLSTNSLAIISGSVDQRTINSRLVAAKVQIARLKAEKLQVKKPQQQGSQQLKSPQRVKTSQQLKTPENSFRLIETADASLEMLIAAKAVNEGLKQGETVVLVSPEKPEILIRKLTMTGMNAASYVKRGKLILLSSQPAIAGNLSLATNYREVFGELFDLAGCPVDRIVVLKMDLLVNLESQYLAYASVSKFTQAADEMGCKFFAQYSRNQSEAHDRLDAACSSLVNAYFVMKRHNDKHKKFQLQAKNITA